MVVDRNTELRKLRPGEVYNLALILNVSDNWKKLMGSVIKEGTEDVPRFTGESIAIIEQASLQDRKPAAAIFIEEWATMGRKRPTLGLLLDILMKMELFRAADYLAEDILKVAAPQRPTCGPAVPIDAEEALAELLRRQNLESQPVFNDSTFRLCDTSEIRLSQINYPNLDTETSITDNNFAVGDTDVGIIEMQYNEPRSNQVLDQGILSEKLDTVHGPNDNKSKGSNSMKGLKSNVHLYKNNNLPRSKDFQISDLMKFSGSSKFEDVEHIKNLTGYSRSDLIKFDSGKTNVDTSKENYNIEICEAYLPNFDILSPNSSVKSQQSFESNENKMKMNENRNFDDTNYEVGALREMSSAELPASLGKFGNSKYFHCELMSAELPVCINDRTGFHSSDITPSQEGSSATSLQSFGSSSSESADGIVKNETLENFIPTRDIPCVIIEDGVDKRIDGPNESKTKRENANNVFDSQELPITVLEFHNR